LAATARRCWWVPLGLVVSPALLALGLSLPLLHTEQLMFWKSTYSVWTGIVSLWHDREYLLALLLFAFSLVFPIAKLLILTVVWWRPLNPEDRTRLLHRLEALGRWSMMDVFVVAILIVLVKLEPLAKVEPRPGVYVFAAAILASMLTTLAVQQAANEKAAGVIPTAPPSR
jgi:paraquat-inducible protein A